MLSVFEIGIISNLRVGCSTASNAGFYGVHYTKAQDFPVGHFPHVKQAFYDVFQDIFYFHIVFHYGETDTVLGLETKPDVLCLECGRLTGQILSRV